MIAQTIFTSLQTWDQDIFAFVILKSQDGYEITLDLSQALHENAFFCYFDPSPL